MTLAAETSSAENLSAELPLIAPPAPDIQARRPHFPMASPLVFHEPDSKAEIASADDDAGFDEAALDDETLCMAKVVHHEASNQSRKGQIAVAQTILNRLESGRFADTICGVVHQRNQYFDTTRYHPRRDSATWKMAVQVALDARAGKADDVSRGALFYRAGYVAPTSFFRTRTRVATLGDHIFYR